MALVTRLDTVAEKLDAVSNRLDTLISSLMTMPRADTQPVPMPILTLPLPPKTLNEMMLAANIPGHVQMMVYQFVTAVPAGTEVAWIIPALPGTVAVHLSPLRMVATYYSSAITGNVYVDGKTVAEDLSLISEALVEFGQYYYMTSEILVSINNASANDTIISTMSDVMAINRQVFELFYVPIINYGYDILKNLAVILNGGREIP